MQDEDRCPECGHPFSPFHEVEIDEDTLDFAEDAAGERLRRDWVHIEELEELVYGERLPAPSPPDSELTEIIDELDAEFPWKPRPLGLREQPNRERLRHALTLLGWYHVPLRSLHNKHGQRRELWVRRMSWEEIQEEWSKEARRSHELTVLLAEYLGRYDRQRTLEFHTETRQEQMKKILRFLKDAGRPQWLGQICRGVGIGRTNTSLILSYLYGQKRIERFAYNRIKNDAAYCHPKHAHRFAHLPVKELLPIDDLDEIDLYEKVSEVLKGHTAVELGHLENQFPHVPSWALKGILAQFGWRFRKIARTAFWVSPEHPHYESPHDRVRNGPQIPTQDPEPDYVDEEDNEEEKDEDILENPPPAENPEPRNDTEKVLKVLINGGVFNSREIAKAASLPTRRTNSLLADLVEEGKVLKFPMGSSEGYVAR